MWNQQLLSSLSGKIRKCFNRIEFQDLCFKFDPQIYDDLEGEELIGKIHSFVSKCDRRGQLPSLYQILQEVRPNVLWLRFLDVLAINSEPVISFLIEESKKYKLPPLSKSVESYLEKIDLILAQGQYAINSEETYVIVAAATLPHLLTANGYNPSPGQVSIDEIKDALATINNRPGAPDGLLGLTRVIEEIVILINARQELSVDLHQYRNVFVGSTIVRLGPLAIIAYLASLLNLDEFISPMPPSQVENDTWEVRKAWWSQAYITRVSVHNGGLCLHSEVPERYHNDYLDLLISPLVRKIERAIRVYGRLLRDTLGTNLILFNPDVLSKDVPSIPNDEWIRLKREILSEQQHELEEERLRTRLDSNQLHELYVTQTIKQAEELAQSQFHNQAAQVYAQVSRILAKDNALLQAQRCAIKAAEEYREAGKEIEAVEQLIGAGELWQIGTRVSTSLEEQLSQAEDLSTKLGNPLFQARIHLLRAWVSFASLSDDLVEQNLSRAQELISALVNPDDKVRLLVQYVTDQVTFAVVWEKWDIALRVLKDALSLCPAHAIDESVALHQLFIRVNTELGEWEVIDEAYNHAASLLLNLPKDEEHERKKVGLDLDYAASIARRGDPDGAYRVFKESLDRAASIYTSYELGTAYQNMQFWLLRSSGTILPDFFDHEVRRLDLHSSTEHLNYGHSHLDHAKGNLLNSEYRGALQHIKLALAHYWRDGNWIGRNEALRILAHLNAETGRLLEATQGSVRVSNSKLTIDYCRRLKETGDLVSIDALVQHLSTTQFFGPENKSAVKALGELSEVIPVSLVDPVYNHLMRLIQGAANSPRESQLFRACLQTLGQLVPQLSNAQKTELLELSLVKLSEQAWTVVEPALSLLDTLFTQETCEFDERLYIAAVQALYTLSNDERLRDTAKRSEAHVARTAPGDVRESIVSHIVQNPDIVDRALSLAFLGEPIDPIILEQAVEQLVHALNRHERIVEQDGKRIREWSLSGNANPLALSSFGHLLPESKHDVIITGILAAITNEHNEFNLRTGVIEAIVGLPLLVFEQRAKEVIALLIRIEVEELPRSSAVEWQLGSQTDPFSNVRFNTGNTKQVRKAALHALGHLYSLASPEDQTTIIEQLVRASRATSVELRQGAALLLNEIQSEYELPAKGLLALVALMHDSNSDIRRIAALAAGKLISQNMIGNLKDSVLDRLLDMASQDESSRVRQHAAVGLKSLVKEYHLDSDARKKIEEMLLALASDISFIVRRAASQ